MKLTDKWSIEKESNGFSLVELRTIEATVKGKKTGELKEKPFKSYYGTVYQALQAFVQKSGECGHTPSEVGLKAIEAYNIIVDLKEKIMNEFRTEVKVVKP